MAEYDAGSAFVSILPSTRGFAQRLKREIAGVQADVTVPVRPELDRRQMSGLQAALKALPAVVLDADATPADREIAQLRARMEKLADQTIGIDISAADAHREVDSIRSDLDRLGRESPDIAVRVDAGAASAALQDVTAETTRLDGRTAKVRADADTSRALAGLGLVRGEAGRLDGRRIGLNVTADVASALMQLAGLAIAANQFANRDYRFQVRADTAGAVASIARLVALVSTLGGLAGVVGGLAGAIGGLGAAGAVAGAGLGATVLGFLGVGKAVSALSAQQDAGVATSRQAAKQQEQHARQVQAAYERVGDASTRVSQARSDAAKSVSRAEAEGGKQVAAALAAREAADRRAARSARDLRQAQSELTSAWEAGRRSLQDLQDQLDSSQLDQRQAAIDLRDARTALDEARASGDTDAIERAQVAYDRQVESIDQLTKRTQRLQTDNTAAQRAGVAGTDAYRAALGRVAAAREADADAQRAAGDAAAGVREAEIAAQQRVDDAREQGARQVESANAALIDSQNALTDALSQTGDAGASSADKVTQAFAGLSPEAARFATYLFGLQPILDRLSASAATALFPPLISGIDTLLTRLPLIDTVVGQLAGGMGAGLNLVLTELASPFWAAFFTMLGDAAGTVIPGLFAAIMSVARAAALLIQALLPLAPAGFAVIDALAGLIGYLAPFLASSLGGMIPAAQAFISALYPLGPLLDALSPILNILGIAFSQVLAAVLQALTPVLVALTPLIQALATSVATGLVSALQAATPFLVAFAGWLSANPGLVLGVVGVLGTLLGFLRPLGFVLGLVATMAIRAMIIGALGAVFTALGLQGSFLARALFAILQPFSAIRLAFAGLSGMASAAGGWFALLRNGIMMLGRVVLGALGPFGILAVALGILYTQSEPFRNAVNGLLGVLMGLVQQVIGAVMPILTVLGDVVSMLAGVFGVLVGQLAASLVPVINVLAGVLGQLINAVLPPLVAVINALLPVIMMLAGVFVQLLVGAIVPLISVWMQLVQMILPVLVSVLQGVVVPVIQFLAQILSGVLVWVITNLVVPATQGIAWFLTNVLVPAFTWLVSMIVPAFSAIAAGATWLWVNVLQPVFGFIWTALKFLGAIIFVILVAPFLIAFNLISAAATWLWANVIQPVFSAIGAFISWVWTALIQPALMALVWFWQAVLAPALSWLYNTIVLPIFNLIGAAIRFVWEWIIRPALQALVGFWQFVLAPALSWLYNTIIKPIWDAIGAAIMWVWTNVIQPAFRAVVGGLDWLGQNFTRAVDWIRDIWGRIRGFLAKPINFMIDVVWNRGVVPAWNKVAELVGLGPIQPLGLIPEAAVGGRIADPATGGTRRGAGGMLRGPGSGTDDRILGIDARTRQATSWVSNDEFVVRESITRRALPFLTALNAGEGEALQAAGALTRVTPKQFRGRSGFDLNLATGGRVLPRFAAGGQFQQRIDDAKRWLSGPARGAPYVYGGGTNPRVGMDCSSMVSAVTHILSGRPPDSGRIGTTATMPWSGFAPGLKSDWSVGSKPSDHMAGTLQGQNVEQHGPNGTPFAFPSRWGADNGYFTQQWHLPIVGGQFVSGGNGGGGDSSWILDMARDAFDSLTNPAIDAVKGFVGEPPPEWRRVPPAFATKIRDTVRDFIFGKAAAAGGGTAVDVSGISGPVVDQVRQVAAKFGWDRPPEWDAIMQLVMKESTWDPGAANTGSSARGLFQKMTSLYGPVEPTPAGQAAWGLGYIRDRYGTPSAAWSFHQRNGSYAEGGQVHGVFDAGGGAIGRGLMFKDVIAREEVLDPVETEHGYRPLVTIARDIEAGRLAPPQGVSGQQISTMLADHPGTAFPTEFALTSDTKLRLDGDGLLRIIDGRLIAVADQITDGRID